MPSPTRMNMSPTGIRTGHFCTTFVSGISHVTTISEFRDSASVYQKTGTPVALTSSGSVDMYWVVHHVPHAIDRQGARGFPSIRRGGSGGDQRRDRPGRRHPVAMLVLGRRARAMGRKIQDNGPTDR